MATGRGQIRLGKSLKYKYVSKFKTENGRIRWGCSINGKRFAEERECALYVDKLLLERGKSPVNILVKRVAKH